jgi:hypothetical protein
MNEAWKSMPLAVPMQGEERNEAFAATMFFVLLAASIIVFVVRWRNRRK